MNGDFSFVAPYCVVIVQDCSNAEDTQDKLAGIVQYPGDFRQDCIEGDEE